MHNITTLNNGIRLVYEYIPYVQSVSVGVWIAAGSVNETPANNGISHFIEHMVFKGTTKRSCLTIAETIDDMGGCLNAFTAKDCTCFYIKALSEHLFTCVDLLADMLQNATFAEQDLQLEKGVVLEEIAMYEDSPEELVHDLLMKVIWSNDSLGLPILGSAETVNAFDKSIIDSYMQQNYTAQNAVISVVGNFDEKELMALLESTFGSFNSSPMTKQNLTQTSPFCSEVASIEKDIEQLHLTLGYPSYARNDDRLYPLQILNYYLGGGVSSRLFQRIREQLGLAYSIYTSQSAFRNTGVSLIYAGINPKNRETVTQLIEEEINDLKKNGIGSHELERSKQQVKSSLILSLESTSARMSAYGQSLLLKNEVSTDSEKIAKIDAITADAVNAVLNEVFTTPAIAIVGAAQN